MQGTQKRPKVYNPLINEKIIGVYTPQQASRCLMDGITKASSFPEMGFRSVTLKNDTLLLIAKTYMNPNTDKLWKNLKEIN